MLFSAFRLSKVMGYYLAVEFSFYVLCSNIAERNYYVVEVAVQLNQVGRWTISVEIF